MEEGSCDSDSLLFTAGESVSQFSDFCVISFWKGHNEVIDGGFFCGSHDLFTGGSRLCDGDIICDGIMEQVGFLCHIAFQIAKMTGGDFPYIFVIYGDISFVHIPETHEKLQQCGFSGAAGTVDTGDLTRCKFQGVVV